MLRKNIPQIATMLMIGIVMFTVSTALAQPKSGQNMADKHLAMMQERLKLTDAQVSKIKTIMDESQKQAMAEREKHKGDAAAGVKFREEHRKATDEKIKAVLNDEQKKEYDKMQYEIRQNMQDRKAKGNIDKMGSGSMRGPGEGYQGK